MVQIYVKTYGCRANEADSAHLKRFLVKLGCEVAACEAGADIIIINSCAIREKAEQKMFSYLGAVCKLKQEKPHLRIGVIGCVASYRKAELKRRFERLDFVFSARDDIGILKESLVDMVELASTKKSVLSALPGASPFVLSDERSESYRSRRTARSEVTPRVMVNIMRGCNNYCSYCIVPFTTGRERSFSMEKILKQVQQDVDAGAKEVTLLGQNVNSYKDPDTGANFAELLRRTADLDGDFWVRFLSPHPKDMTNDVLDAIAENKKLCSHIHLPMQSGSNKILSAMNRTYTVEKFLDQIDEIRLRIPNATITTDIIVGFPGETEADYEATREVMERVRFHTIFSYIYSPRKYTKAAELADSCSPKVKVERIKALQKRQREIGTAVNRELIGKKLLVLIEGKADDGVWWGRTEGNVKMFIPSDGTFSDDLTNKFVMADVIDAQQTDISGLIRKLHCER